MVLKKNEKKNMKKRVKKECSNIDVTAGANIEVEVCELIGIYISFKKK